MWLSDTLAFKPYPGCAYLQAAVDVTLSAEVSPADVRDVEIAGGYLTAGMEALGERAGLRPVGVTFSAKLSVAVAILAGRLTHNELDGSEPGACGHSLAQQREVVERKMALTGIATAAASAG